MMDNVDGQVTVRVTKVENTFALTGMNSTTAQKRVWFVVGNGTPQYVDVPLSDNWTEVAKMLVMQHAQEVADVMGFSGAVAT